MQSIAPTEQPARKVPDLQAAGSFCESIGNRRDRSYARGVFVYYRDYGTPLASGWPFHVEPKSETTRNRIANTIRALMVGDCASPGSAR